VNIWSEGIQLQFQIVQWGLCLIVKHKAPGAVDRDLTGEFRPDRARGTGDHDALSLQVLSQRGKLELDRIASQQILHLD
jgi:hypothetical protein